jgi:dynein heavy chain
MQAAADAEDINSQEKLFGMASSKYSQVARMAAKLEPYCGLWTLAARFYDKYAGWMSGPFSKLKPEEVETEVSDAYRKVYKLSKVGSCLSQICAAQYLLLSTAGASASCLCAAHLLCL